MSTKTVDKVLATVTSFGLELFLDAVRFAGPNGEGVLFLSSLVLSVLY